MAKEFPYFRWYPKDAESDDRYSAMDDAELGFFHRCLNKSWMNEGLPADADERARVLKTPRDVADARWHRVGKCFIPSDQFQGKLINPRQEIERCHAFGRSRAATGAVRTRYERSTDVESMGYERSTDVESMGYERSTDVRISTGVSSEINNLTSTNVPTNVLPRALARVAQRASGNSSYTSNTENPSVKNAEQAKRSDPASKISDEELQEICDAFDIHLKHDRFEPRDMTIQTVMGINGTFDWEKFRRNHPGYCRHYAATGWRYCTLSFLAWIRAGMPPAPPEPERKETGAEKRKRELMED